MSAFYNRQQFGSTSPFGRQLAQVPQPGSPDGSLHHLPETNNLPANFTRTLSMKGLEGFDLIAHRIVAVKNLGGADRLFGGTMLAWLDEAGASYAILKARSSGMVTRHIEAMDFLAPGRLGDVLGIYGRVSKTGRTSISVEMRVLAEDPVAGTAREIVRTTFVFVAVDKEGTKTAIHRKD